MKLQKILICLLLASHSFINGMCTFGSLQPVTGSPFAAGNGPISIAFSPLVAGNLFAGVPNILGNNISVYRVNQSTGAFTAVGGSPLTAGTNPSDIAFSSIVAGNLFAAVSNRTSNNISVYSVNQTTGGFTPVAGSPFAAGTEPISVAFSPVIAGNLFAAAVNITSDNVSVYSVNQTTGAFTPVAGSPFATGNNPQVVVFSPIINGNLFAAVTNGLDYTISMYSVNPLTGVFTPVLGSPFPTPVGGFPIGAAFSPVMANTLFLAITNVNDSNVSVYAVNPNTGTLNQIPGSPFAAGLSPYSVAFSPIIADTLFAAVSNVDDNTVSVYIVDQTTGQFTQVAGSPFATGLADFEVAFSPIALGNLFAATSNNGSNNASVYKVCLALPPTNLKGCKGADIFLLQKELVNILTWNAPVTDTLPVSYSIYADAGLTDLLETVPATQLRFIEHNLTADAVKTYYVVANYANGSASVPVSVTVTDACLV